MWIFRVVLFKSKHPFLRHFVLKNNTDHVIPILATKQFNFVNDTLKTYVWKSLNYLAEESFSLKNISSENYTLM